MRILFITNSYSRIILYNLVKELKFQHEIHVISFDKQGDQRACGKNAHYQNLYEIPYSNNHKKLFLILKSLLFQIPFCVLNNESKMMSEIIKEVINKRKIDIVIIEQLVMGQYFTAVDHCPYIFFPLDAVSRAKKQRYVVEKNLINKAMHYIDYLIVRRYEKFLYSRFKYILFVSKKDIDYTKHVFPKISPSQLYLIPHGVDLNYFHPKPSYIKLEDNSLVFVGNMTDYKNEDAVLWFFNNIWKELMQQINSLKLYIVGNNPSKKVRNLSKIDLDVIVTGFVNDIREYVWKANIFISPLRMGTGIKNRVLQAMAMGKPVIGTFLSFDSIDITNGENAIVVKDAKSFIDNILMLIEDKDKARKVGYNARKFVEKHHSWKRSAKELMRIINTAKSSNYQQQFI